MARFVRRDGTEFQSDVLDALPETQHALDCDTAYKMGGRERNTKVLRTTAHTPWTGYYTMRKYERYRLRVTDQPEYHEVSAW